MATASSPGAPSDGRIRPAAAARAAVSAKETARSVPATRNAPSRNSTSSAAASRESAATGFAVSIRPSTARTSAPPPIGRDQEPPVPVPLATRSVSPCTTRIFSNGRPSRSFRIWL